MARVVVIGAGLAGLATAVRLAKLGHQVTVCERDDRLGGSLGRVEADGFTWDTGAASTTLPAALRDLFRKSGRPLDKLAQLDPITGPRRHLFTDGTVLDLPVGDRAGQSQAWAQLAGARTGRQWTDLVDGYGETWQLLRKNALEPPLPDRIPLRALLDLKPWRTLDRTGRRLLDDQRARAVLNHYATLYGSDPARTSGYVGVWSYVERTFGQWTVRGGFGTLVDALARRVAERGVEVRTGAEVVGVTTRAGVVEGVRLADGTALPAGIVVSAIDPQVLYRNLLHDPAAARERSRVLGAHAARAPHVVHLGLREPVPDLPFETVLHGSPAIVVRTGGEAPAGHHAWSVLVHGVPADDVVDLLAARGLPVGDHVVSRQPARSWWPGIAWEGARTPRRWAPNTSAVLGLYCVGAGAHPGAGVPATTLGAAIVAAAVGKA